MSEYKSRLSDEKHTWIWIMLLSNIALFLILMLIGFIALKVGNYLPDDSDVIVVVGKSETEVTDEDGKWESGKNINIFKASYSNGAGETTVVSQDGTKIIAPGTLTTYKFSMYNNADFAVSYESDIEFTLRIGNAAQNEYVFPLKVRLATEDGFYLIGSEEEWESLSSATVSKHASLLGKRSYEKFILELLWDFNGDSDELDTLYGDMSSELGISLTLGINTYAESHYDPDATGGVRVDIDDGTAENKNDGILTLLLIIFLVLTSTIIIFYISWLMTMRLRKKKGDSDTD